MTRTTSESAVLPAQPESLRMEQRSPKRSWRGVTGTLVAWFDWLNGSRAIATMAETDYQSMLRVSDT